MSSVCQCATINDRRWLISSSRHHVDDDNDSTVKFRVATYNILSDNAFTADEYLYCPSQLRYMSSRHQRIITEVRHMQPHLICFQVSDLFLHVPLPTVQPLFNVTYLESTCMGLAIA